MRPTDAPLDNLQGTSRKGLCLVLSAPSGAGKSTLVSRLRAEFPGFAYSISCTTRVPRGGEQDGVHYHFLSREAFIAKRDAGHFAEWAEVHGNFYGTPRGPVEDKLARGQDMLFDIDVQGALQLKAVFPQALYVFILPPSREVLERRLRRRGTDSEEVIERRMKNALGELRQARHFEYHIVNDDLEEAANELRAVYVAGRARAICRPGVVEGLLAQWESA